MISVVSIIDAYNPSSRHNRLVSFQAFFYPKKIF